MREDHILRDGNEIYVSTYIRKAVLFFYGNYYRKRSGEAIVYRCMYRYSRRIITGRNKIEIKIGSDIKTKRKKKERETRMFRK